METLVLPFSPSAVERASALLREGQLVAIPTETVYGLGARADDSSAVRKIFEAKGRPATNPLIVHVADVDAARALVAEFPPEAERLAQAFWPGPLTLVCKLRPGVVADEVVAGGDTIGLRVPAAPVARALLEACRLPVAAPSANRSLTLSPTTADHVLKSLGGRIPLVLDGGASERGIESTIVDVSRRPAVLLRPGALSIERLRAVADVVDPGAIVVAEGKRNPAPGTSSRHYAPRATLVTVSADVVQDKLSQRRAQGLSVGALVYSRAYEPAPPVEILPADPEGYAAGLYAALHRLDDAGCDFVIVADPPSSPEWLAVRDRLARAACSE